MNKIKFLPFLLFLFIFPQNILAKEIMIIPIKGVIDLGLSAFVKREVKQAEEKNIKTIILEMDTPGGRVDAADIICNTLMNYKGEVITYVLNQAWSAGAMISLSTDRIIMAPGASIGSSEPRVGLAGGEKSDEKLISAIRARFKAIAEEKKHSPALAQAMVDKDLELKLAKINGEKKILTSKEIENEKKVYGKENVKEIVTISKKGKLLNLSSKDAVRYGLAEAICRDRKTLLAYLDKSNFKITETKPTWSEVFVRLITHPVISSLLLGIGFWAIIIELRTPGFGIPGIVGITSLALFFWGHKLAGLAQWTDLLFLLLGVILLFIELFFIPGFGFVGGLGIILIIVGIILTLISHPIYLPLKQIGNASTILGFSFLITIILFILSMKILPKTKLWQNLVLNYSQNKEFKVTSDEETNLIEKEGISLSDLRPSGKAKFDNKIVDVQTSGEYIEKGENIKIIEVKGNKIKVKKIS
jgi:membrane-bound serine protease (ClpP class)